jgi:predicted transcriptional regulator
MYCEEKSSGIGLVIRLTRRFGLKGTKHCMTEDVLGLTAQIVSAHVKKNAVPVEELTGLIRAVHKALAGLSEPASTSAPAHGSSPAVQVTKSVFPDYVVCLECGKKMTMLKRHLMTEHSMSVEQYRSKFGLPGNYPMVAPNYATTRSNLAKEMGLGKSRTVAVRKAGRKAGGRRAKG